MNDFSSMHLKSKRKIKTSFQLIKCDDWRKMDAWLFGQRNRGLPPLGGMDANMVRFTN